MGPIYRVFSTGRRFVFQLPLIQITKMLLAMHAIVGILLLAVPNAAMAKKRLALIIGNDAYENVTPLQKAANDADTIGQTLAELGFKVTVAKNLARRDMNKSLQAFHSSVQEGDIALFFYAGHGVEIDGENYLLPTDVPNATNDQLEFIREESIRLNRILADLKAKKAGLNLVILDACRNNPFAGAAGRSLDGRRGLARISAPQGTFVMYSADVGEAALDRLNDEDSNPNSVFTRTLVPLMKKPGLDLVDTARETRRRVRNLALTVSHNQTPAYYDAVLGDFYFTTASLTPDQATTPPKDDLQDQLQVVDPKPKPPELKPPKKLTTPGPDDSIKLPAMVVTAGEKDLIRLWDAEKFKLMAELSGEKKLFSSVKFINNGRGLLVGGKDGSVVSYSLPSFKKTNAIYPDFEVSVFAQADDGTILIGGANGLLAAYDGNTLIERWRRQAHDGIVSPVLPRGNRVVSASEDGAVVVTDIKTGEEVSRTATFSGGKITDVVFINADIVAASHEKGVLAYINLVSGKVLNYFKAHDGWISSVDLSPTGSEIVTAGVKGSLRYWPIGTSSSLGSINAHSDVASGAKFMKSGQEQTLASVSFDGKLKFWESGTDRQVASLEHGPAILFFDYVSSP